VVGFVADIAPKGCEEADEADEAAEEGALTGGGGAHTSLMPSALTVYLAVASALHLLSIYMST